MDSNLYISQTEQPIPAGVLAQLREMVELETLGGPGSGNFGHAGRPGEVGGSAPDGGGPAMRGWESESIGSGRTVSDAELRRRVLAATAAGLVYTPYNDERVRAQVSVEGLTVADRLRLLEAADESYKLLSTRTDKYDYKNGGAKRYAEFEKEARAANWSAQQILDEALERGLVVYAENKPVTGFEYGISSSYVVSSSAVLSGLGESGRDQFEQGLLASSVGKWSPDIESLTNAGWTTPELERFADRVQAAGGSGAQWEANNFASKHSLATELAYYSRDYETFSRELYSGWAIAGSSRDAMTARAIAAQAFPLEQGEFYDKNRNLDGVSDRWQQGQYHPSTAFSPRAVENMRKMKAETEAFYAKKLDKTLELGRGIGGHVSAYTPGAVESWTTDKRTVTRFEKMMSNREGHSSKLSTAVTYRDVLWSYESAKGKPGWPDDKELKGKKEFVILGSRIRRVMVVHGRH